MRVWAKRLFVAVFVIGLAGCDTVIDTQPYLVGTFTGSYQPDTPEGNDPNNPLSYPVVIQSKLTDTTTTRYDFEGTVKLNGETYSMTGYEESTHGDLAYLKPQARGVFGNFLMNLNEAGTTYSVCGEIIYGSAGGGLPGVTPQEPRLEYEGLIISAAVTSWEACVNRYDIAVGVINDLEKQ